MFGGSKTIVGLDIGSSCIKAVELKRSRAGIEVAHLGVEPLASDVVVDSMIMDSPAVASAITKLFADSGIKTKAVATSVSGHSVIVKRIPVTTMTEDQLADSISTEAAQHIPFDITDVNIDYQILSDDLSGPQMDVLLVAVKKDKILNYTNVLSMAGKAPTIVDIDVFALQNCYEYNYEPAPGATVALLNLGASVMNIMLTMPRRLCRSMNSSASTPFSMSAARVSRGATLMRISVVNQFPWSDFGSLPFQTAMPWLRRQSAVSTSGNPMTLV